MLAIVGESGCGKSVTAQTIMGLTRAPNAEFEGRIVYEGADLVAASDDDLRKVRGNEIAMIFQDPMTSLHPVYKVGWQIAEEIKRTTTSARPRRASAPSSCCATWASRSPSAAWTTTRTSSPAACASAR